MIGTLKPKVLEFCDDMRGEIGFAGTWIGADPIY
jgi:hypothetical protein